MTDLLVDMTNYAIANGIATEDGLDIFQNNMPDVPDFAIALSEYAGLPQTLGLDIGVRSVQVKVRAVSNEDARIAAWKMYNLFYNSDDPIIAIKEDRFVVCRPRQTPYKLTVDSRNRPIWNFNMGVTTYNEK